MKIKKFNRLYNIGRHVNEPVWKPKYLWITEKLPTEYSCWLTDYGSLTKQIIQACDSQFKVRVLKQYWARPMLNETLRLGAKQGETAFIREVILYCGTEAWVFARTIIPRNTLTGKQRHLSNLGTKPLGAILFSDAKMYREEIEIARIEKNHEIFSRAMSDYNNEYDKIWGRRSMFYIANQKPLLVNEVFLPNILNCKYRKN